MKKIFVLVSLVAFFGVLAAPVFAAGNDSPVTVNTEKPKANKAEYKKNAATPCCEKAKACCDKATPCCEKVKAACDKEKK